MKQALRKWLVPMAKPVLSRIHRFRNAHRGESCYLIGDGITIKWFDLGVFADKTAIPCAFIPFHNEFNRLSVRYLSCQEPWWFYPWERTTDASHRLITNPRMRIYRELISANPTKEFFVNLSNAPVLWNRNVTFTFGGFHDPQLPARFITNRADAFHGSLRFSISLALYLGFEQIYLVGYDYTHVPSRTLHWYEKGQGNIEERHGYYREFFKDALEFADITTITLDGSSDVLKSVTYQEYSKKAPAYRENTELMDERYLRVLDTWPGYTIF